MSLFVEMMESHTSRHVLQDVNSKTPTINSPLATALASKIAIQKSM